MYTIRQQKLACENEPHIQQFLSTARTGCLGLSDGEHPYVVPLNFIWLNGALYFHGAAHGRKVQLIQTNKNGCFTVYEEYGTMASPVPAKTDTAYMSVMLFGTVEEVHDLVEATAVMQALLDKYVPHYYEKQLPQVHVEKYRSSLGSHTAVFKLTPSTWTAKENRLDSTALFYPGRTMELDV